MNIKQVSILELIIDLINLMDFIKVGISMIFDIVYERVI